MKDIIVILVSLFWSFFCNAQTKDTININGAYYVVDSVKIIYDMYGNRTIEKVITPIKNNIPISYVGYRQRKNKAIRR